jgi:TctA family transporter
MEFKINFRIPSEFIGLGNRAIKAFLIWGFYCWKNNMCDIWIDYGFRILGIEFNVRKHFIIKEIT